MLDVRNPHLRVEEVMRRIQEEVRARRDPRPASDCAPVPAPLEVEGWHPLDEMFARAEQHAHLGVEVPPMSRLTGLQRTFAVGVAKAFLRIAQLITRDQREFNLATLQILRSLYERSRDFEGQLAAVRAKLSALEARVAEANGDAASDAPGAPR